jgi:excinuclease UvrABC ATPase subunit
MQGKKAGQFSEMTGSFQIKHIEYVDQNPIGRSSRSNPYIHQRLMMTLENYMQRKNF